MLYVNSKLANVPKDLWLVHPKTWKVTIKFQRYAGRANGWREE